jgi:hypothetical protein
MALATRALIQQGFALDIRNDKLVDGHQNGYRAEIICVMDRGATFITVASEYGANDDTRHQMTQRLEDYMKSGERG